MADNAFYDVGKFSSRIAANDLASPNKKLKAPSKKTRGFK